MSALTLPSVLAFNRKLEPSDALMHSGNWEDIDNVLVDTGADISLFSRSIGEFSE